jgi:hypothetical protein
VNEDRTMTRLLISALLLATAAPAMAADMSFPVGAFQKIAASGSEDLIVTTGKAVSVTATGPQDRLDRLDVRVEENTLRIGHKKGNWSSWNDDKVTIRVTLPALHGLRLSGSGDATADAGSGPDFGLSVSGSGNASIGRITSPAVAVSVAGSGDANIGTVATQALAIKTSGSGDVTAAGTCATATISVSGSSTIDAARLKCTDGTIGISGSGDVKLAATGTVAVRISGSGDVVVTGGARCTVKSSGSGDVTCG